MAAAPDNVPRTRMWGFLRQRSCWVPTWRGCLAGLVVLILLLLLGLRPAHSFLAVNEPGDGRILVAEAWMPDFALKEVLRGFDQTGASALYLTGGPLEQGAPLAEYGTYPELTLATIVALGHATNGIHAVPAPDVKRDRTYTSAITLKHWLEAHGGVPPDLTVISIGPHARRTRLLFQLAFGEQTRIGIIALPDERYDATRWWTSSIGFRTVVDEWVAYLYARLLFDPERS